MYRVTLWLTLPALLIAGCSRAIVLSDHSVILAPSHAQELAHDADGSWMPSRSNISDMEKRLPDFLQHHTALKRSITEDYKQYVGITRAGRRLVFLSAFSIPPGAPPVRGWQSKPIIWGGGGDTVWRIQYDPQQKLFEGFQVNGPL